MITFDQFYKEFLMESAKSFTQYTFKLLDRDAYLQNERVQAALNNLSSQDNGLRILSFPYQFAFEKQLMKGRYKIAEIIGLEAKPENLTEYVIPAARKLARHSNAPKIYLLNKGIGTQSLINKFSSKIFVNVANGEDKKSVEDLQPNLIDLDYVGMYSADRRGELLHYSKLLKPGGLLFITYSVRPTSGSGVKVVGDLDSPTEAEKQIIEQLMPSQELNINELKDNLSKERKSKISSIIPRNDEFKRMTGVLETIIKRLRNPDKKSSAKAKTLDFEKYTPFGVNKTDKYLSHDIFYKVTNDVKKQLRNFELLYANVYRGGDSMSGTSMIRLILQKDNNNTTVETFNASNGREEQHLIYEGFNSAAAKKAWLYGDIKRIILLGWSEMEEDNIKYDNIIEELQSLAAEKNISIENVIIPFLEKLLRSMSDNKGTAPAALQQQKTRQQKTRQQEARQQEARLNFIQSHKHIFETNVNELKKQKIILLPDSKNINDFISFVKAERFANPASEFSEFLKDIGDTLYYGRREGEQGVIITISSMLAESLIKDSNIKYYKLTPNN
jgi:hypothetical protein